MRKLLLLSFLLAVLFCHRAAAQPTPDMFVVKDVVILQSTPSYSIALRTARQAASRVNLPLDLEGLRPHTDTGLTWSKADCAANGFEYPSYIPRGYGLAADSAFISIEYSTDYSGFAKGYYLVVAAVGQPRSPAVHRAIAASRRWYADAYAKRTEVYIGCMH